MPYSQPVPLSGATPPDIALSGDAGAVAAAARADHTHASSVQRAVVQTASDGTVSWTFPKPYAAAPTIQCTVETPSGQPYVALITDRSTTLVTIKVLRAQTLPASLTLLSALVSFNVFAGSVGAGVTVHLMAAKAT